MNNIDKARAVLAVSQMEAGLPAEIAANPRVREACEALRQLIGSLSSNDPSDQPPNLPVEILQP